MAKGSKGKRQPDPKAPPLKAVPSGSVLPAAESSHERVCWRFTHSDHGGRWRFCGLLGDDLHGILEKMSQAETMTVGELTSQRPFYKEYGLPGGLIQDALERLSDIGLETMTAIQRLQFTGKQRLYGFLVGNVFHVVWWDPDHEICPSHKKHT